MIGWALARRAMVVSLGWAVAVPEMAAAQSAVEVADSLYLAMDAHGAIAVLNARLDAAPEDFEALWRRVRAALTVGILTENRDEKLRLLREGEAYGGRLLALRPGDPTALAWAAAVKGRLAMDVRKPVMTAKLGKEAWGLTGTLLAADAGHPMGNDIRGKLIQEILKLSWAERVLARLLLGGDVMSVAHWDEAERHLERAVEGDPGMVVYHLDLGDTYRLQGREREALEAYRRGLGVQERYPVDAYFKRRIQDGMRKLGGGSDS